MKIRYVYIVIVIFLLLSFQLTSAEIQGIIRDINYQPLKNIKVSLKNSEKSILSDQEGKFIMPVPKNIKLAVLVFTGKYFHTHNLTIEMNKNIKYVKIFLIPREHLKEELSITALNREQKSIMVPMTQSVVSELEIKEKIPENIVSTLTNTPGIHFIGKGGFSVTPSIRGLARRKIVILIDGIRLTGDRRAGISADFINPELIKRIEVVRSSSSVHYGSDAMGGVIQLFTQAGLEKISEKKSLNLNFNTANQRMNGGFILNHKLGNFHLHTAFQYSQAGNYQTPIREIYNSQYKFYSSILALSIKNKKRDFSLAYLGGYCLNIGKASRENNPLNYTVVPKESNQIIKLQLNEKSLISQGDLNFSIFINPTLYQLKKENIDISSKEIANTTATNYGLKATFNKKPSKAFSYQLGIEGFFRNNVDFENRHEDEDNITPSYPLSNGKRQDLGIFFSFDYSGFTFMNIIGGIRYSHFSLKALVSEEFREKKSQQPSFFFGLKKNISSSLALSLNLSRAFRLPSLSESYYTGITGRKYVVGNEDLKPETCFNIDTGINFYSNRLFLGLYVFSYHLHNMIERFRNKDNIYSYQNIDKCKIYGSEFEFQIFPAKNVEFFGHFFYYRGRNLFSELPLNDIPAAKMLIGGKLFFDHFWTEVNYIYSFRKDDPGPAEIENKPYQILNLKGGYYFSTSFFLYLKIANLFNEIYYANSDPDIPESKGLDIAAGIQILF